MLELRDLSVRYGSGRRSLTAVDRVSLDIPSGATLGLVGESGSGKSTLARAIVGLLPIAGGSVRLDGADHTRQAARTAPAYRRRVQMVFQDPHSSLNPRMSVGQAMVEAVGKREGELSRAERRAEAVRALESVGLGATALERYPHEFSGGQRQRIAIARALAVRPQLIVLDEVTSALDVSVQATILNLLTDLQREFGLSYLFVSHNLSVVSLMSEAVAVMYLGRIVERGPAGDVFGRPRHPYTQALMKSLPSLSSARAHAPVVGDVPDPRNLPPGCPFHTRCPVGPLTRPDRSVCLEQDPQLVASSQPNEAACHFAAAPGGAASEAAGAHV